MKSRSSAPGCTTRGGATNAAHCGHGAGRPSYAVGLAIVSTTPQAGQLNPKGRAAGTAAAPAMEPGSETGWVAVGIMASI